VLALMGVALESPDHTTLSRRSQHLDVALNFVPVNEPVHLIIDSTELSIVGDRLRARHPKSQEDEAIIACNILNRMIAIGRPESVAIGSRRRSLTRDLLPRTYSCTDAGDIDHRARALGRRLHREPGRPEHFSRHESSHEHSVSDSPFENREKDRSLRGFLARCGETSHLRIDEARQIALPLRDGWARMLLIAADSS
jgi:hypothetical protein